MLPLFCRFGIAYLLLALFIATAILRLCRQLNLLSRGTFLYTNTLLFLTASCRGFYLMLCDHGSSSHTYEDVLRHMTFNFVLPGIFAVYSIIAAALVKYSQTNVKVGIIIQVSRGSEFHFTSSHAR